MYAYFKKLDYFSTECVYAPFAARGFARDFVKELERSRPQAILDVVKSAESFRVASPQDTQNQKSLPEPRSCERCGYISSQKVCKACILLEGLNKGMPRLGVAKNKKQRYMLQQFEEQNGKSSNGSQQEQEEVLQCSNGKM
eukprot:TRINITY_DN14258_c0_g1_i3.p4 TRINITY_DN14258_c0_g1~~TRINITY_DN14258_c0_g1_i3.p4  ORF type:complete len:141 (+),score=16.70 TRINITY_DN14258_c0_g1_i3:347-769(+)